MLKIRNEARHMEQMEVKCASCLEMLGSGEYYVCSKCEEVIIH